jgi:hypothetical protein
MLYRTIESRISPDQVLLAITRKGVLVSGESKKARSVGAVARSETTRSLMQNLHVPNYGRSSSSPTADIIDKDRAVGCSSGNDFLQQLPEPCSVPKAKSVFASEYVSTTVQL